MQKKAREFALKEILPLAWFYDEANEMPMQIINKASALGLMNGGMPKKYGGLGYGSIEGAIVTEEIAAVRSGVKLAGRILKRSCPAKLPGAARYADIFIWQ